MLNSWLSRTLPLLAAATMLTACDGLFDVTDQAGTVDDRTLEVVRVAVDAPPLADTVVSFWAVRGASREVEIRYLPNGIYPGGKCLRFRVPSNALLQAPDGRRYAEGDSVRISIRVIDPNRFLFEFAPAGLKFSASDPASLEVRYRWADRDYNGDGVLDARDAQREDLLAVWKQELPGTPWRRLNSVRDKDAEEVHVELTGFTRYAVASN